MIGFTVGAIVVAGWAAAVIVGSFKEVAAVYDSARAASEDK